MIPPAFLIALAGIASAVVLTGSGTLAASIDPAGQAGSLGQTFDLQPILDSEGRFVINLPITWGVTQSRKDPALSAKSPEPPGAPPDTVEVFVRDTLFALSPEGCGRQVAWVMSMTIHEWTTLSEGPDSIGGLAAFTRAYTWHLKTGEERRSIQTCVPLGRRVFVIIGTTKNSPRRVAEILPELARIIGTFRPGPAPGPPPIEPRPPSNER
jgi:hypothetical protein